MEELERILRDHAKRYPELQPTDAVKLVYQNEFGGGHMIRDEHSCRNYLRNEYASVEKNVDAPLYEDIGNGIVRVNLAAVSAEDLEQLGDDFIRSAAEHKGNLQRFCSKLNVLKKLAGEGVFAFGAQDLAAYLADYEKAGYPAVSHSQRYRDAYKPAYRVVLSKNATR